MKSSPGKKDKRLIDEEQLEYQCRTKSNHCKSTMARMKQKGFESKMHRHDPDEKADRCKVASNFATKQSMRPLRTAIKSEHGVSSEACQFKNQSVKSNLQGPYGITTDVLVSKKIKFTVKAHNPNEEPQKPVLCLCSSQKPNTNRENLTAKQHSCSLTDDTLLDKTTSINNTYQKHEGSSFDSDSSEDSNVSYQSNSKRRCKISCICGICLKQFPSAFLLEKHRRQSKHWLCSHCGKDFNDCAVFENHVSNEECKRQSCSICTRRFVVGGDHKMSKTKSSVKCPDCQKWFDKAETLSAQNDTSSSGNEGPYCCSECDKTFLVHSRYKTHMMATHTGERPFVCPECGKGFARMYALSTHMIYTHNDEKKFKCEFCPKSFKRKDHLKSHEVIHSLKKPYHCDSCGHGFNQKVSLKKHLPCDSTTLRKRRKATETTAKKTTSERLSSKEWYSYETSEVQNNAKNVEPNHATQNNVSLGYLGCRCPPTCPCKPFTIAVNVSCDDSSSNFREVGTLPCCCSSERGQNVSQTDNDMH